MHAALNRDGRSTAAAPHLQALHGGLDACPLLGTRDLQVCQAGPRLHTVLALQLSGAGCQPVLAAGNQQDVYAWISSRREGAADGSISPRQAHITWRPLVPAALAPLPIAAGHSTPLTLLCQPVAQRFADAISGTRDNCPRA